MLKESKLYKLVNLREGAFEANTISVNVPERFYNDSIKDREFIADGILVFTGRKEKVRVCFETKDAQKLDDAINTEWKSYTLYKGVN